MNQYNVWNKWGKLKTVMLGSHYTASFFDNIKNSRIRSALQRIADETQEDLDYYQSILKEFGCTVIRPELNLNDSIMNYINQDGAIRGPSQGVPRSPLQVRDSQLVLGKKLYHTNNDHESIIECLSNYNNIDIVTWYDDYINSIDPLDLKYRNITEDHWNILAGADWGQYDDYKNNRDYFYNLKEYVKDEIEHYHQLSIGNLDPLVRAPCITGVGRDVYVENRDIVFLEFQEKSLQENIPNVRINKLHHGGHSDGCFHTLKPGVILSLFEIQNYESTFPGWDVCYLPDQSWAKVDGFLKLKEQVGGKWWVPGEEENNEFTHFVETWLQDWVGYAEESVFDVNVLVLDEHHVCVNNMNPTVIEFLKKHNMEPVHVPWRHRYFWDGGLHCITLDLEREGDQEDYFPLRGNAGIIDHGFD